MNSFQASLGFLRDQNWFPLDPIKLQRVCLQQQKITKPNTTTDSVHPAQTVISLDYTAFNLFNQGHNQCLDTYHLLKKNKENQYPHLHAFHLLPFKIFNLSCISYMKTKLNLFCHPHLSFLSVYLYVSLLKSLSWCCFS